MIDRKEGIVSRMQMDEVDAVHAIECCSITPPWTRQGFVDGLKNENAVFLVVKVQDVIVGYCGLYQAADEGEITNIAIDAGWRGNGLADCLLSAVLKESKARGVQQIFLEVRKSNIPAQHLYKKHGFEEQGIRKHFYRDPKEDAIVMRFSCQER